MKYSIRKSHAYSKIYVVISNNSTRHKEIAFTLSKTTAWKICNALNKAAQ